MPDVTMPDGTVIYGVPEGTTQSELLGRLRASGRYDMDALMRPPTPTPTPAPTPTPTPAPTGPAAYDEDPGFFDVVQSYTTDRSIFLAQTIPYPKVCVGPRTR